MQQPFRGMLHEHLRLDLQQCILTLLKNLLLKSLCLSVTTLYGSCHIRDLLVCAQSLALNLKTV